MLGWLSIQPILGRSPGSPLPAIPSSLIILNEKVYMLWVMSILVLLASPAFIHSSWSDDVPHFSLAVLPLPHYSQSLQLRWVGLTTFSAPVLTIN